MSLVQVPRTGVPDVSQKHLIKEFHCEPPLSVCYTGGGILCCGRAVQLVLKFFPEGIVSYVAEDLLCLWEEVSSGSSCATILNCLLFP